MTGPVSGDGHASTGSHWHTGTLAVDSKGQCAGCRGIESPWSHCPDTSHSSEALRHRPGRRRKCRGYQAGRPYWRLSLSMCLVEFRAGSYQTGWMVRCCCFIGRIGQISFLAGSNIEFGHMGELLQDRLCNLGYSLIYIRGLPTWYFSVIPYTAIPYRGNSLPPEPGYSSQTTD